MKRRKSWKENVFFLFWDGKYSLKFEFSVNGKEGIYIQCLVYESFIIDEYFKSDSKKKITAPRPKEIERERERWKIVIFY